MCTLCLSSLVSVLLLLLLAPVSLLLWSVRLALRSFVLLPKFPRVRIVVVVAGHCPFFVVCQACAALRILSQSSLVPVLLLLVLIPASVGLKLALRSLVVHSSLASSFLPCVLRSPATECWTRVLGATPSSRCRRD